MSQSSNSNKHGDEDSRIAAGNEGAEGVRHQREIKGMICAIEPCPMFIS